MSITYDFDSLLSEIEELDVEIGECIKEFIQMNSKSSLESICRFVERNDPWRHKEGKFTRQQILNLLEKMESNKEIEQVINTRVDQHGKYYEVKVWTLTEDKSSLDKSSLEKLEK